MSRICFPSPRRLLGPGCLNGVAELPHPEGVAVHEYACLMSTEMFKHAGV